MLRKAAARHEFPCRVRVAPSAIFPLLPCAMRLATIEFAKGDFGRNLIDDLLAEPAEDLREPIALIRKHRIHGIPPFR